MILLGRLAASSRLTLLCLAACATSSASLAQTTANALVPAHATARGVGGGWSCDRGFRAVGTACQPVSVPSNAYLEDRGIGRGWECAYGFRFEKDACTPVVPPEHGFVTGFAGDQWSCERTFVRDGDHCVKMRLPANAISTSRYSTSGWTCERGYLENDGRCERIVIPPHAYLDTTSPAGWTCERGYRFSADHCQQIVVPANGYSSSAYGGPGFECERGYRANDVACVALTVPSNAHLDHSGNDWDCNRPYRRQQGGCELTPYVAR